MTCIVGFIDKNNDIYIGADSSGVDGHYNIRERLDSKVFIKNNMIFGFTSSFRMGQLIRYQLVIPEQLPSKDDYTYMCTDFIEAIIKCFKDHGYAKIHDNEIIGGFFLVGYKGKLYQIECDFQVAQINCNYDACGCGESYAMGAMEVLNRVDFMNKGYTAELRIKEALSIAEKFSAGVSKPFNILCLKYQEQDNKS